ncbi:LytTR family DNA-binding domain-containing protein [Bacillus sp. V5-8f]|uniref:LytR/AlgR family response regulator transcription factor n=1 Tax=Bacillus sp. V5-8f TaxID=2053044 RepID=UPI000C7815FA|nr:LytTR family DNA-binding domain-containing protein [Bacillus sp. V5-8f]PLT35972.1 DNA-binding response regulator [Bacillus sp. V5-8f]
MLQAFLVDDEPLARDELKYLLLRTKQVEIVGEASSMDEAMAQIPSIAPDLVFLDIQLAEDSGLHLAEQLHRLDQPPAVIFATAYDEYALEAFELHAVDYILKPFDEARLQNTLEKISRIRALGDRETLPERETKAVVEQTGKLAVMAEERIILVDISSIVYIGSTEGKTLIKTTETEYKISDPLVLLEKKLPSGSFVRVHRSFLVNINAISEIEPWFHSTYNLLMKDGSKVPVSRTYVKELKQVLGF